MFNVEESLLYPINLDFIPFLFFFVLRNKVEFNLLFGFITFFSFLEVSPFLLFSSLFLKRVLLSKESVWFIFLFLLFLFFDIFLGENNFLFTNIASLSLFLSYGTKLCLIVSFSSVVVFSSKQFSSFNFGNNLSIILNK